jgi:hypothetical protein
LNIIGWLINIIGCLVASQAGWLAGRLPGFANTPVSRSNICVAITYVLRISNFSRAKICSALPRVVYSSNIIILILYSNIARDQD